jgi:hypothetical protein
MSEALEPLITRVGTPPELDMDHRAYRMGISDIL